MQKKIIWIGGLFIVFVLGAAAYYGGGRSSAPDPGEEVRSVVSTFGQKIKNVPLAAPREVLVRAIREAYGPFVSPELLVAWEEAPERVPGRLASTSWPDRIEILELELEEDGAYAVQAKIVEVTSMGVAVEYPIALKLRYRDGRWIITGLTKAIPQAPNP